MGHKVFGIGEFDRKERKERKNYINP